MRSIRSIWGKDIMRNRGAYIIWLLVFVCVATSNLTFFAQSATFTNPNMALAQVDLPLTPPNAPQNITIVPKVNSLDVFWDPPVVDGNNAATSYIVDWDPGAQSAPVTFNSFGIPNLIAGTTYMETVMALNDAGMTYLVYVQGAGTANGTIGKVAIDGFYDENGYPSVGSRSTNQCGQTAQGTFHAAKAGKYFVAVSGQHKSQGLYRLTLVEAPQALNPDDDTTEFAASTQTTGRLSAGGSVSSFIGAKWDRDWFRIDLQSGKAYRFEMAGHDHDDYGDDLELAKPYIEGVFNADGEAVSDYALSDAATTCVPLPPELRGSIADIVLAVTEDGGGMTVLSTSVKITPDGVSVCGKLSTLPATVAAGKVGSPPEVVDPSEDDVAESPLPDTGGESPSRHWVLWLLLAGAMATALGTSLFWSTARSSRNRSF